MQPYRAARAIRILTALVTLAYFGGLVGGTLLLVGTPAIKLFAPESADWKFGLPVRAELRGADAVVATRWAGAQIELEDVRGALRLPISAMPWSLFVVLWTYIALALALMLLFLHHLRRVLHRARDGAPFDPDNAGRLRLLGLLGLALALLQAAAEFLTSLAVNEGLTGDEIRVPTSIHVDGPLVLFALVLLTLAEIFRHGAELEHEQSLVV
jgi:hypothetical protein